MNKEFDDFSEGLDSIIVNRERPSFKLHQLKLEHFYFYFDSLRVGMPIKTSVELNSNLNKEKDIIEWKKTVSHTYVSLDNTSSYTTDSYSEDMKNSNKLIEKLEKYDLRRLNNNYFTEEEPEKYSHWELTYNDYFKVVGTYDQSINEFDKISDLLDFKTIINDEVKKIKDKLEEE